MKRSIVLLAAVLRITAAVHADLIVDNFEGYTDTQALQAAWVPNTSSAISNEELRGPETVMNNSKFMLLQTNAGGAGYMQTKYNIPGGGAIWNIKGINLTSLGYTGIQMRFAVPFNGSGGQPWQDMGGIGGNVFLRMYDCWGQNVFRAVYPGTQPTPGGTGWSNGIVFNMPFVVYTKAGMNLENVFQIAVGFENTYYGTGALLIDNVILTGPGAGIPEPATMVILGLGGLLFRRRK